MSKSWTLFHLDGEHGLRGGERQLLYLAAHARTRGHDNVIVCRRGSALADEAQRQDFACLHVPFLGELDPISAWQLRRAASGKRALFHAHTAHGAALGRLASLWGGPPLIVHRRVDFPLRGWLSRVWKYDGADRVIAVSENIRNLLLTSGMQPNQIDVIPDCLPISETEAQSAAQDRPLAPAQAAQRESLRKNIAHEVDISLTGPWIGNLAAWVPHKDQATLLQAWPLVIADHPQARLLLVGGGPLESDLKKLAQQLGIENSVVFAGHRDNPADWLRAFDLYVQSSWGEGMGSVLLEAMACGVPIVATTAGGIPEVVKHDSSALLSPPRNPEALGTAILGALANSTESTRRVTQARKDLEKFSLTAIGDKTLALYAGVQNGHA
jgi:glycosyltransferase involved in cell wall biosynthesis